jgi:beta-ribofuranosylaminobenzene 5'-phosphate synthase
MSDTRCETQDDTAMSTAVSLSCTARLHLGFLDLNGGLGRRFGSIGLSLDRPHTALRLSRAARQSVAGPEAARAGAHLAAMQRHLGLHAPLALEVRSAIPAHSGLGSGTQLALLVATAVRRLHGLADDPRGDAWRLGRGGRSGVGICLFQAGGLVVDGGSRVAGAGGARTDEVAGAAGDAMPPLLCRVAVPQGWRVLLVLDRTAHGLSGAGERAAFAALGPMPEAVSGEICRRVLMQALPAVAAADLAAFGEAVTRIQALLGDYFAPAQGGRFTSPAVAKVMAALAAAGAVGVGQSSWGPSGFAFVEGDAAAARLRDTVPLPEGVDLLVCRGLNRGAAPA